VKEEIRMRKMRLTIAVAAVAALAFSGSAQSQEGPILIGSSIPLTGGVATFGQHSRWGSELAIAETNAKGGVLGRKLEMDFQDNRCNPAEAVKSVTQMLAEKKYVAIFDGLCSSAALAIMPLVERAGVPFVVANASATSIAERSGVGGNKWTFKVNPTDASMLDALISWLDKDGKANNIAFLGEDTDFGRAGSTGLENALKKRNLKLATVDFYQKGMADFTPVFTKIKAKKPALLALYAIDADFQNAMRQWYTLGGGIPLTGRVLVDQVPKEIMDSGFLDGTTSVQPYDPSVDTPGNKAFVEAFRKLHNVPPILVSFESYEATKVLIDAIRRAGKTDPAAIRDALATTKMPSMLGTTIEFDDHNLAHNNAIILTIKGGKVVVVGMSKT
jgi:branched-chain amino acid transport system substrate-binding protein